MLAHKAYETIIDGLFHIHDLPPDGSLSKGTAISFAQDFLGSIKSLQVSWQDFTMDEYRRLKNGD
jgi:hypothetical protein